MFLSAERTIEDLTEDVTRASKRVAILTDFDQHGKRRTKRFFRNCRTKLMSSRSHGKNLEPS